MYKFVFQNSKVALLFAGMTLFSAVSMVGTSEDKGALTKVVDRFGAERSSFAITAAPIAASGSQGPAPSPQTSVFSSFDSSAELAHETGALPDETNQPINSSSAPAVTDSTLPMPPPEPYMPDREMTIEAE